MKMRMTEARLVVALNTQYATAETEIGEEKQEC